MQNLQHTGTDNENPCRFGQKSAESATKEKLRGSGGGSNNDKGAAVLIIMFVGSIALMIAVVFTLNLYMLAIGGIMFVISIIGLSWGQPPHNHGGYGGYGT